MRAEIANYVCAPMGAYPGHYGIIPTTMCAPTLLCMDVRNHNEIIQMARNKIMDIIVYTCGSIMLSFAFGG